MVTLVVGPFPVDPSMRTPFLTLVYPYPFRSESQPDVKDPVVC